MIKMGMGLISRKCIWQAEEASKIFDTNCSGILIYFKLILFQIVFKTKIRNRSHKKRFWQFPQRHSFDESRQIDNNVHILIFIIIFKIVSEMKASVNKFDYPTASSATYKLYKQTKTKDIDSQSQKAKYRQFDKQQRDIERMKVKQEQERKIENERRINKKKLQEELEKKKQELIQLQKMKNRAMEQEKKSHQLAILRQEEERLQKLEQQRRAKENQYNAQNRFIQALKRLEQQKEINSKKQKEAIQRRRAADQTEKIQRSKAIKYRQEVEQKQKALQSEQKRTFNNYKQPLGRTAYNRSVDYTKTFLHNPNIIISGNTSDTENAISKAEQYNNREKQKSADRKARQQENRRLSEQRGKKALEKLALEKEYQQYLKMQQQKAKLYNMQRIEAGKKNQYVGLKPATLLQMEVNKKIRGEEQFEKMFFGGQNPEWFDRPTNRYNIVQSQLAEIGKVSQPSVNRNSGNIRSLGSIGAVVSDSHYSFQSQGIQDLTSVKKAQNQEPDRPEQKKRVIPLPRQLNQPNSPSHHQDIQRKRGQLSYSDSQGQQV